MIVPIFVLIYVSMIALNLAGFAIFMLPFSQAAKRLL
jgi:hypothetical protein